MALPSSGPLSLNDIATEFGGATPHSLSEYYAGGGLVPAGTSGTYGAVPSSGTISIQNFYGTSNIVEFIGQLAVNTPNMFRQYGGGGIAVDGNNNFIFGGDQINNGSNAWFAKYNGSGTVQNQWQITDPPALDIVEILRDSSNNFYVLTRVSSPTYPTYLFKYNSSGSLVFGLLVNFVSVVQTGTLGMAVDSGQNIILICETFVPIFELGTQIIKLNSSGSVLWSKEYFHDAEGGVAVDSSDNIYFAGRAINNGGAALVKINSSGTFQWERRFYPDQGGSLRPRDVQIDPSGNPYMFVDWARGGYYFPSTAFIKTDSSGNFQYIKSIGPAGGADESFYTALSGAIDSAGNVYTAQSYRPGGYPNVSAESITKWNSSGTLQWQRKLENANGIATNSPVNIITAASQFYTVSQWYPGSGSGNSALFLKAPQDGSKTGTYTLSGSSFVYSASSLVDLGLTVSGNSNTDGNYDCSASTSSYTPTTVDPARTSTITII